MLSLNSSNGNKSVSFAPEDQYYDSNEWYVVSRSDKDNFFKGAAVEMYGIRPPS